MLLQASRSDSVQNSKRSQPVDITRVLGHLERNFDVRLGSQIVNLGRLTHRASKRLAVERWGACIHPQQVREWTNHDLRNNVDQVGGIGQITIVKHHLWFTMGIGI